MRRRQRRWTWRGSKEKRKGGFRRIATVDYFTAEAYALLSKLDSQKPNRKKRKEKKKNELDQEMIEMIGTIKVGNRETSNGRG